MTALIAVEIQFLIYIPSIGYLIPLLRFHPSSRLRIVPLSLRLVLSLCSICSIYYIYISSIFALYFFILTLTSDRSFHLLQLSFFILEGVDTSATHFSEGSIPRDDIKMYVGIRDPGGNLMATWISWISFKIIIIVATNQFIQESGSILTSNYSTFDL